MQSNQVVKMASYSDSPLKKKPSKNEGVSTIS